MDLQIILDLLMMNLPAIIATVVSFLLGLVIKSPIYQKGKDVLVLVLEAIEDGKVTKQEVEAIIKAIK